MRNGRRVKTDARVDSEQTEVKVTRDTKITNVTREHVWQNK